MAVPERLAAALDGLGGERRGAATAIPLALDGERQAIREATVAAALAALTRLGAAMGERATGEGAAGEPGAGA